MHGGQISEIPPVAAREICRCRIQYGMEEYRYKQTAIAPSPKVADGKCDKNRGYRI